MKRVEREGQALLDAAIHRLSLDDAAAAGHLLRHELALHATPEVRALSQLVAHTSQRSGGGDHGEAEDT